MPPARCRTRLGLRSLRLSSRAEDALRRYRWPGNVREVEYVISRAALKALSRGADRRDIVTLTADVLDLDGLEITSADGAAAAAATSAGADGNGAARLRPIIAATVGPLQDAVRDCQRRAIRDALELHGNN